MQWITRAGGGLQKRKELRCRLLPVALAWCAAAAATSAHAQIVPGRYIVEIAAEPAIDTSIRLGSRAFSVEQNRQRVRDDQERFVRRAADRGARVTDRVDTVMNALVVEASDQTIQALAQESWVKQVYPVRLYKPLLDRAVVVQGAVTTWLQTGGASQAGAGMRIGIIDTGIDSAHPAFQDSGLTAPDGFPRVTVQGDMQFTNGKVIVARNYDSSVLSSARDVKGHGTSVAMVAAGGFVTGPFGAIQGIAPRAYLGAYKVFPDATEGAPNSLILRAIDDAVADRMDIINLSLGGLPAGRLSADPLVSAIERATEAGVLVTVASGNEGPDLNTIGSPGTAHSAITVGNSSNARVFASELVIGDTATVPSLPGSGPNSPRPIRGELVDVASLDRTGLACTSFPGGSLNGRVALILRGDCFFSDKLNNAQQAGAVAAVVYSTAASPEAINMGVGQATLPAVMVSHPIGLSIRGRLAQEPGMAVTVGFEQAAVRVRYTSVAGSSSKGPSVDLAIKPDLLAIGSSVYTAAPSQRGAAAFTVAGGTSLAAPMVAGGLAVLKAARPGLSTDIYRSMIIHTATPYAGVGIMSGGAGLMNVAGAYRSTVAATPVTLGFGVGGATIQQSRTLTLTNTSNETESYTIAPEAFGASASPAVQPANVTLAPGRTATVTVSFAQGGLATGAHEGSIVVRGSSAVIDLRIPYWYAAGPGPAERITLLDAPATASREDTIHFRVTDAAGLALMNDQPVVTLVEGRGSVASVSSADSLYPGTWRVRVLLGVGANRFRIEAGGRSQEFSITGN